MDILSAKAGNGPDDLPYLYWQFPVAAVLLYVIGKYSLVYLCRKLGTTGESTAFKTIVVLHNIALCLFSLWSAVSSWTAAIQSYNHRGFLATYCDYDYQIWYNSLAPVYWLFYLSKIWEFADTLILIVKQKPVSLLQFYHHCGALLTMWGLVVTRSSQVLVFVCLNSVIHTIMYAYFTSTALKRPFPMGRSTITQMQLAQFFIGWAFGTPTFFALFGINSFGRSDWIPKCNTEAGAWAAAFGIIYLLPLVILFIQFYIKNYIHPSRKVVKKTD